MIVITGASGFIGSHVLEAICKSKVPFLCLCRESLRGTAFATEGFPTRQVDFESQESLNDALKGCATLVHILGVINAEAEALFRVNVGYTRRLVESARINGVQKIIFMSSVAAIRRHGPYGESKYQAEEVIRASGIPYHIIRPAFVYGPGDGNNIGMMMRTITDWPVIPLLGGGDFKLQPVYVTDVVGVLMKMIGMPGSNQAYSVAGSGQVSLKEMLTTLARHLRRRRFFIPIPLKPVQFLLRGYIRIFPKTRLPVKQILELDKHEAFDISDAQRVFGFNPMTFQDGTKKMFQGFLCAA